VSVLCNSTQFESVVVGMFIITAIIFTIIGYNIGVWRCTKKLEKTLEEMTEE
jgi:cbb3-type cytochrome oxidase subunit 1